MIITSIEQQKRANRYNIFCDGEFIVGVSIDSLVKFSLRKGEELVSATIEKIKHEEEFRSAKQSALRSLARSMRSEKEIREKLKNKKFHTEIIEEVILELRERDFLNDERFAKTFVADTSQRKNVGTRLLQQQLFRKGIAKQFIEESLKDVPVEQEMELALALAKKKKSQLNGSSKKLEQIQKKKRIGDLLLRRGFSSSITLKVLKQVLEEEKNFTNDFEE